MCSSDLEFKPKIGILLYLLSNKIFHIKGIKDEEFEKPKDIESGTGIVGGTLRRCVSELLKKEKLLHSKDGKYYIPNHSLRKVEKFIIENDK